ncbi:hypothetical protein Pst134EB_010636 [Puccinia striiformis f. sp. tritici]|nr:hypothetical protein Pst134EB_010636 [Puccinia striiformis f. sp. tritici]
MDDIPSNIAKAVLICKQLQGMNVTPKEFIDLFLKSKKSTELATRRKLWFNQQGANSTISLLRIIRDGFMGNSYGQGRWKQFIAEEASQILLDTKVNRATSDIAPYMSSQHVTPLYFTERSKGKREQAIIQDDCPFLYNIISTYLNDGIHPPADPPPQILNDSLGQPSDPADLPLEADTRGETMEMPSDAFEAQIFESEGIAYASEKSSAHQRFRRNHHLATTICSMVMFSKNRRNNGIQLHNGIRFLACGVSERVNNYLHKLALTCSRQTAIDALETLAIHAEGSIKRVMSLSKSPTLGPFICIDNLDIMEKVHKVAVGHRSMMYHGTWGYLQLPNQKLLESLDQSELNLNTYLQAIKDVPSMPIDPQAFMQTPAEEDLYYDVWLSQIARVLQEYIAVPAEREGAISTEPPVVEQISCQIPSIYMLKLMDESDDSAEGIGQVMESVQRQSGLTPEEFFARLQPMDADLATIKNFNSLRDIRSPSDFDENNMNNIIFQLGGAHTLWNIAQTIFTTHFGDPSNEYDLGAWRLLEGLGIPHDKVLQKKDFTLMLQQLELVHKATLYYCLRVVMNINTEPVSLDPQQLPTAEWNAIIVECYNRFCSPQARARAADLKSPKQHNLVVRLQEFSTVVEANNAMKAGDIGRLMNVWKMWSVMAQSLPGLTHYASYLPRLVLLLNEILPPSLSKLLKHNLLFSPSGRPGHFVAKDFYLENCNYWLKFFFNRGGVGTDIQRLKELYSTNIILLQSMFHSLQVDSGKNRIYQSHKNSLDL